jgi:pyruvate dehydrogenase (quinone)
MGNCDTLLIVGSNDPWTEFYPAPAQARAVQIDIDGRHLGNRYPVEVGLTGDAAETLEALLPCLADNQDKSWRTDVEDEVTRWHRLAESRAGSPPNHSIRSSSSGHSPHDYRRTPRSVSTSAR